MIFIYYYSIILIFYVVLFMKVPSIYHLFVPLICMKQMHASFQ